MLDPANYSIAQANVNPEAGTLLLDASRPPEAFTEDEVTPADNTSVILYTQSQNEVTYELLVTNLQDADGRVLAAPEPEPTASQRPARRQ